MYNGLLCILLHYHNARCMSVRKTRNGGGIIIIVEMRTFICHGCYYYRHYASLYTPKGQW